MPLLRYSLYSQNVNLYLAPTADAGDTWLSLMRTIASEGKTVVLSANQCVKRKHLPAWIDTPASLKDPGKSPDDIARELGVRRRRSTVTKTEDNHEISWPSPTGSSREHLEGSPSDDGAIDGSISETARLSRRNSVISSNEDSIRPEARGARRRKSIVTKTKDNHEITWLKVSEGLPKPEEDDLPESAAAGLPSSSQSEEEFVCRGGSCIVGPAGDVLAGPLWEVEEGGLLMAEVDFADCLRGRLDLDVAGSYSRNDSFKLTVEGLDLDPPP